MASRTHRSARDSGRKKRVALRVGLGIAAAGLITGLYLFFAPNTGSFADGEYLYIRTGSGYADVKNALADGGFVRDIGSFDVLARQADYPDRIHPGKYLIPRGAGNYGIVRLLRSGRQTPVRLAIGKLRTTTDFIRILSTNLEADSGMLRRLLEDTVYLAQLGLKPATVLAAVLPDTYEFYWNTDPDKAFRKIQKTAAAFWTPQRQELAGKQGLTREEVATVAAIVEEETNNRQEKPLIASVYLNRLRKNMKLQADPTARYAGGDFTIRRVTSAQTSLQSPYNTYAVSGLPPGPICTPSRTSVEAVLHAPHTDYLYFCAKEDFSGTHNFAATYAQHQQNARRFQAALNARGIH